MKTSWIAILQSTAIVLMLSGGSAPAGDAPPGPVFYCPFDGDLVARGCGAAAFDGEFSRRGPAWRNDFSVCAEDVPRFESGRFGRGIFIEAGHRGHLRRGQLNYLSPNQAGVETDTCGFAAIGRARIERKKLDDARQGSHALLVSAPAEAGFRTDGIEARYWGDGLPAATYIGSVYLKGAKGGERVRVLLRDETNAEDGTPVEITLTREWRRVSSPIQIKKDRDSTDLRLCAVNAGKSPAAFYADALMIEHSGRYGQFSTASSWVPGWTNRWAETLSYPIEEHFNPKRGAVAFWLRPSPTVGNHTYFCVGRGWKTPFRISARDNRLAFTAGGVPCATKHPIEPLKWYHVAMCWSGGELTAYLNGELILQKSFQPLDMPDVEDYNLAVGFSTGDVTGADGTLDEFVIFDRPLSGAEVAALASRDAPLATGQALTLRKAFARAAASRSEMNRNLPFIVRNVSGKPVTGARVRLAIDGHFQRTVPLPALKPGKETMVELPVDLSLLRVGPHRIEAKIIPAGGSAGTASFPLYVGPFKHGDRMPLVAWMSFDDFATAKDFADHGVTASYTYTRRGLDICTQLGMDGGMRLFTSKFRRYGHPEDLVLFKGELKGIWWQAPAYREFALKEARKWAAKWKDNPAFVHFNINTEQGSQINTSKYALEFYRKALGFDMPEFNINASIHPPALSVNWPKRIEGAYPKDGIVEPANKWWRFFKWYWEEGSGVNTLNDAIAREAKRINPNLSTLQEPALRWPPVFNYHDMDVLQEWVYVPDPKAMLPVLERLQAACRGKAVYSGMAQLLFKRNMAAPFDSAVNPDIYREALWIAVSRPVKLITIWGWHLVRGKDDDKKKHNNPETYEEIKHFAEGVLAPYGPFLRALDNRPRKVAYLWSLASDLFRKERFYFEISRTSKRLASAGILADTLYDDAVSQDDALDGYEVLILAHTYAIPRPVYDKVVAFVKRGGLVIADEEMGFALPKVTVVPGLEAERVKEILLKRGLMEVECDTPDVVFNLRRHGGTNCLIVVNDKRESGPLFGEYGLVKEKGVAQAASFRVKKSFGRFIYDLTASRPPAAENAGDAWRIRLDLPPCGGRIVAFYQRAVGRLTVEPACTSVKRGSHLRASVRLEDRSGKRFSGLVPVLVEIRRPDGSRSDLSHAAAMRDGVVELDIPVAFDDPTGVWALSARELATGQTARSEFDVR